MTNETVTQYLETLLWSETLSVCDEDGHSSSLVIPEDARCIGAGEEFDDGTPLDRIVDVSDLDSIEPNIRAEAEEDLDEFQAYCEETLGFDPFEVFDASQVAHDFALSRNGHGAGFFDGDYTHEGTQYAQDLQRAAKTSGPHGLTLWVDGDTVRVESHG